MPYVPPDVKERIKREVSVQRLAEARGIKLVRSGKELIGLCPFHDDHNPEPEYRPGEECVELQGRLRRGRRRDPVGDAGRGSELPSCAGVVEEGSFSISCRADSAGEAEHGAEAARAGDGGGRGPGAAAEDRGLLSGGVQAVAGGAAVSGEPGVEVFGDGRAIPSWLRQPDAGAAPAGEEPRRRRSRCGSGCRRWASCGRAATSTSTARWLSRSFKPDGDVAEMYGRKINDRLREGTPTTICTSKASTGACGTKRR